jgi:hypothetical protein
MIEMGMTKLRFALSSSLAAALLLGGAVLADDPNAPPAPTGESAAESLPPDTKLAKIEAYPPSIELASKFAYRQLLLTGVTDEGARIDVTRVAQLASPGQAANVVAVSSNRLVRAAADGSGELKFELAGQSVSVPVKVSGAAGDYTPSFVRDVMPTMSKLGCNAGTCHGSA